MYRFEWRILKALADGETDPAALAALAPQRLCDALGACTDLKPVYRRLLKMTLEQLQFLEQQIGQLDQELATLLHPHQDAVHRLAEVPGFGVDSAQQIIAEVGPTAATFPFEKCLSSWVGACPGDEESAGVNYSHHSPKGNRQMPLTAIRDYIRRRNHSPQPFVWTASARSIARKVRHCNEASETGH